MNITWKGSPNFWKNRTLNGKQHSVKRIVIHWFGAGTLEGANARFQNAANQVSAHYGISKGRIWQWVKETDAAWHSGNGTVNLESIGIEHDANPNQHLSEADYNLSAELLADIARRYNLPLNRSTVIGHNEVKATACPGTVDINRIIDLANNLLKPIIMPIIWKRLIVANDVEPEKVPQLEKEVLLADEWYKNTSGGKVVVETKIVHRSFKNIPIQDYGAINGNEMVRIMAPSSLWFDENLLPLAKEYGGFDEVALFQEGADANWILPALENKTSETILGLMFFNSNAYLRAQRTAIQVDLGQYINPAMNLYLYSIVLMHETSHALFWTYGSYDPTHTLFYSENMKDTHKIFDELNYEALTVAIENRRKVVSIPPQGEEVSYFRIKQGGKQGIIASEKWSGAVLFEDKWAEYQTLLKITNDLSLNTPVIEVPQGKFFRINDHGKLGIMVIDGFAGGIIWESEWSDYQKLLQISGMTMSTPEIVFP